MAEGKWRNQSRLIKKEHARLFFRDLTKADLFKDKDKVLGLRVSLRHARERKMGPGP